MIRDVGARQRGTARRYGSYQAIAESLRGRVECGEIPVGHYFPTERELQEAFSASRSTVRRALSALAASGWGRNVPSKGVVAMRPGRAAKSQNIALIDSGSYVLKLLFVRISELLRAKGYHLVHLGSQDSTIEDALTYAVEHEFAGAFVWPFHGYPNATIIERLAREIPIVALDHAIRGCKTDIVTFDYFSAAYEACMLLVGAGRKRIGIAGMLDMLETTHERFSGYLKARFDGGTELSPSDFAFTSTSGFFSSDTTQLERRFQDPDRPDAIFVLQDMFVPPVIEAVLRCGLSLPDDVAVVCIGDDIALEVDGVGLTSVACDWEQMAVLATELLFRRLEEPSASPETVYAPHRLVVRGLCGSTGDHWTPDSDSGQVFPGEAQFPKTRFQFRSSSSADLLAVSSSHLSHRRSM